MRRLALVVVLSIVLPALWVSTAGASSAGVTGPVRLLGDPLPATRADWTVALYVDADNNLDSAWRRFDRPELKRLPRDPRVTIVALVDRRGKTGVQLIQFGGGEAKVLARYHERDFGNQACLTWFLRKVAVLFPSDHLLVDTWDHGGAWTGLCWDETSHDQLTMAELRGSLVEAGVPIDVLACDTCLSADVALAYDVALTGAVDYLVASEESVPFDGFSYDAMLAPVLSDPARPVTEILNGMVDGYERYYRGLEFLTDTSLSTIDVSRVGEMRGDLQRWSAALKAALATDGPRIASDLERSPWASWSYQVDLGAVAGRLAADEWLSSDELRAASAAIAADQHEAVLAVSGSPSTAKFTGLTVWCGAGREWRDNQRAFLHQTAFAAQTGWYEFLRALDGLRPRVDPAPSPDEWSAALSLNDVVFTDVLHGYAVGFTDWFGFTLATALRTGDGGATWHGAGYLPQCATFSGVTVVQGKIVTVGSSGYMPAALLRFGVGPRRRLTWLPSPEYFFDLAADATTAWASGSNGTLLATADGGRSWRRLPAAPLGRLTAVALAGAAHGWVISEDLMRDASTISASTDGGTTFTTQLTVPGVTLRCLQAFTDQQLWACGGDRLGGSGIILHSADGGATWAPQLTGSEVPQLTDVSMRDSSTGCAVGDGGAVYRTTDGGLAWQRIDVPTTADLKAVTFSDTRHGCIVGDGMTILVTADGGQSWREHTADAAAPVAPKWVPATHE